MGVRKCLFVILQQADEQWCKICKLIVHKFGFITILYYMQNCTILIYHKAIGIFVHILILLFESFARKILLTVLHSSRYWMKLFKKENVINILNSWYILFNCNYLSSPLIKGLREILKCVGYQVQRRMVRIKLYV